MRNNLDCKLIDFFNFESDKGQCILKENSGTYITLYNKNHGNFKGYMNSLQECFSHNNIPLPADIGNDNTIWLEFIQNKSDDKEIASKIKGLGKKMLGIIKLEGIKKGFKYIFLYPSKKLGGTNDQEALIRLYEQYGFRRLNNCIFTFPDWKKFEDKSRFNEFDDNAPYHLMFAELTDLVTSDIELNVCYREKYLKYKSKYLALKKIANY
jgi:hypothetical protein